jgi:hypothetical protein
MILLSRDPLELEGCDEPRLGSTTDRPELDGESGARLLEPPRSPPREESPFT